MAYAYGLFCVPIGLFFLTFASLEQGSLTDFSSTHTRLLAAKKLTFAAIECLGPTIRGRPRVRLRG